jgi:hypothetical protein
VRGEKKRVEEAFNDGVEKQGRILAEVNEKNEGRERKLTWELQEERRKNQRQQRKAKGIVVKDQLTVGGKVSMLVQPSICAGLQWRNWDERWEAANKKGAVMSPEDPEAPTTTPMSTPTPTPGGKRNRSYDRKDGNYNRNRNNGGHVNKSTRQHGECGAGGGKAQELSWEVWALGDVMSDGHSSPGARHRGREGQRQRCLSWFFFSCY